MGWLPPGGAMGGWVLTHQQGSPSVGAVRNGFSTFLGGMTEILENIRNDDGGCIL